MKINFLKIGKGIYYFILGCIALVAVLLVISVFPITGNFKIMVVQSGSMEPAIHTGSIVLVKPAGDYKIGDVITFGPNTKEKAPTTHRIADMKVDGGQPKYITRGDANNANDSGEVDKKEVIGKVLFSVPYAGYAIDFAKKPWGFMLIIVIPAVIIIYDEVRNIWSEAKNLLNEKKAKKIKVNAEEQKGKN